jgi:hypothetical protein
MGKSVGLIKLLHHFLKDTDLNAGGLFKYFLRVSHNVEVTAQPRLSVVDAAPLLCDGRDSA